MSSTADDSSFESADFPYRSISRLAVLSVVLVVFGSLGLASGFEWILAASLLGTILGVAAVMRIRAYPTEYAGMGLAVAGLLLNLGVLVGGVANHTYVYMTEVPDGFTRVDFAEFEAPKDGNDIPTQRAVEMHGKQIFLKGYVHSASGDGRLRKFILVPDLGTCCFGGQPQSTSMIEVTLTGNQTVTYQIKKFKLAGTFEVDMGTLSTDFNDRYTTDCVQIT